VKVIGLSLLGPSRTDAVASSTDGSWSMRAAIVTLASQCVLFGVLPSIVLSPALDLTGAHDASLDNGTVAVPGASLPILLVTAAGALMAIGLVSTRRSSTATSATWACGQPLDDSLLWTSAGFTKALRLMLALALRPQREISHTGRPGVVTDVSYRGTVPHLFDTALARPLGNLATRVVGHTRRLQSGSLAVYVSYLLAVLALIALLSRVGAFR
jgi:hypothetical protein